eukprot:TRINITY_DN14259_c1_g1_i4.p2 TRINITY_DN14259_c1_g1~~TRINITY_DN14259_c1_g1_i4.p2  ORF type:complete len:147 (-),score=12.71 TRINITY_DN14259_c1_g1_i4:191-631(-)
MSSKETTGSAMARSACNMHDYVSALESLEKKFPGPHYVLFTASIDSQTGEPWCPDCRRSLNVIRDSVAGTGGTLLEIMVGDRSTWKSPEHPFRHDPTLKLSGIPTLMKWEGGQPVARTGSDLERAQDEQQAKQVLTQFLGAKIESQ